MKRTRKYTLTQIELLQAILEWLVVSQGIEPPIADNITSNAELIVTKEKETSFSISIEWEEDK